MKQPISGYRAGGDPIFLAAALAAKAGDSVLDLGGGVGTAGFCLMARCPGITVDALEIQKDLAHMALENAQANQWADRYAVHCGDVQNPPKALCGRSFDWVMSNPPWTESGAGTPPPSSTKAIGHVEADLDLSGWIKAALGFLRNKGHMVMIHRADRVDDIIGVLAGLPVGAIRIRALYPNAQKAAIRVIVSARKGVRSPAEILPGLVLHQADGTFTPDAASILEQGHGLEPDDLSRKHQAPAAIEAAAKGADAPARRGPRKN